jgi:hypothetical protein
MVENLGSHILPLKTIHSHDGGGIAGGAPVQTEIDDPRRQSLGE